MKDIGEYRVQVSNKGKAILHASKSIKNTHISTQITTFQQTISVNHNNLDFKTIINNINVFREGIQMTGSKLNKDFKNNIIKYCDMSIEYYTFLMPKDFECPDCGSILKHIKATRYECKSCNKNIVLKGVE